jgi:uncharacterized membrane protein YbhN (UPF0104 family)
MKKQLKILFGGAALLIVIGSLWFFFNEFQRHLVEINEAVREIFYLPLAFGVFLAVIAYLLVTQAWRFTVNELASPRRISMRDAVPAVNIPSLTKYLPGKVWSYTIQMYWLGRHGFSPGLILYANLLNVLTSLLVSAWLGSGLLLTLPGSALPSMLTEQGLFMIFGGSIIASFIFVFLNRSIMDFTILQVKKMFGKEVAFVGTRISCLVKLQFYYVLIYAAFGLSSFYLAAGIGQVLEWHRFPSLVAAVAIADSLGFLVILVPGGFGVRESVMLLLLENATGKVLALLLPIASRLATMLAEIILGLIGLALIRAAAKGNRLRAREKKD